MGFQSWGLRKYRAHFLMTLAQMGYTILYFMTEAAFNRGLSPYIYVTYRHILAAVVTWPFAYFLERYTCVLPHFFLFCSQIFNISTDVSIGFVIERKKMLLLKLCIILYLLIFFFSPDVFTVPLLCFGKRFII